MARQQNLGASQDWFIGEDKALVFEVYSDDEVTIENVTGMAFRWVLRQQTDGDAILLSKTTGAASITITGSFSSDPDTNTQRVNVAIDDTDTDNIQPGVYQHALKITDSGNETIVSYGTVHLKKAAL